MKYTSFQNLDGGRTVIAKDGTKFWHWLTIVLLVGVISTGGTYFQRKVTNLSTHKEQLVNRLAKARQEVARRPRTTKDPVAIKAMRIQSIVAAIRHRVDARNQGKESDE